MVSEKSDGFLEKPAELMESLQQKWRLLTSVDAAESTINVRKMLESTCCYFLCVSNRPLKFFI